jgi:hypothetical protein
VAILVRPHLSAMQNAKDANRVGRHDVGGDIGRARDDEFARASDPAGSPAFPESR